MKKPASCVNLFYFWLWFLARKPVDIPINGLITDIAFSMGIYLKSTRSTGNESDQVIGIDDDRPDDLSDILMGEIDTSIKLYVVAINI